MKCENCGSEHEGSYGSGRFCSSKCARGFSTKNSREDINEKVRQKLRGVPSGRKGQPNKYVFTKESIQKGVETKKLNQEIKKQTLPTENLSKKLRKELITEEQGNKCLICGLSPEWNGLPLAFHLDHIDGDNTNNIRTNLRIICPNCHSQTSTYCGRNKGK
jgi:5-methylcytosine-specific restriction endonuclease McrA